MTAGYTSIWTKVRGLKVHAYVSTQSPTDSGAVILVHGLGVSARYMLPTLSSLAPSHKVFAPELPGFGQSDKPAQTLDIPVLADILAEWATTVGLDHAAFLGNSMGCQVIIDLAVRYPALVDHAILVGPTVDSRHHTMPQQIWRGIRDLIHEPWSLWPILARDYLRSGTLNILRTFRFALRDPVEEKCAQTRAPTLVVRGARDPIAPMQWVENLASKIEGAQVAVIPGGTHATNYSAPNELAKVTRDFLNSH